MRNLILITVDCLRADHLGCYGHGVPTTPFLDRLSRESLLFEQAIVAGTPTYYSFPAILASRSPLALGRDVVGLAPGEMTLTRCLQRAGFETAAFLAGNPYLSPRGRYHEGFDVFEDFLTAAVRGVPGPGSAGLSAKRRLADRLVRKLGVVWSGAESIYEELLFRYWSRRMDSRRFAMADLRSYPAADEVIERALAWLRQDRGPFFLWIHLMDPHHPYYPPEEALRLLGRADLDAGRALQLNALWNREHLSRRRLARHREDVVALYDAGVRWVDEQVARLAAGLDATGLWERTVLALTADHGESFLEHGERYHYPVHLSREVTRVPLLIRSPEMPTGERIASPFSLVDLAPTVLAMAGVDAPVTFAGTSRWRDGELRFDGAGYAITECVFDRREPWRDRRRGRGRLAAIQTARHKLVVNFETGAEELYDLEADPGERAPLAAGAPREIHLELLRRLLEHLRRSHPDPRSRDWRRARLGSIAQSRPRQALR